MTYQCEACWAGYTTPQGCYEHMRGCRVLRDRIIEEKLVIQEREPRNMGAAHMIESYCAFREDPITLRYRCPQMEEHGGSRVGTAQTGSNGTKFVQP